MICKAYNLSNLPQVLDLEVTQQAPENEGVKAVTTIAVRSTQSQIAMSKSVFSNMATINYVNSGLSATNVNNQSSQLPKMQMVYSGSADDK